MFILISISNIDKYRKYNTILYHWYLMQNNTYKLLGLVSVEPVVELSVF